MIQKKILRRGKLILYILLLGFSSFGGYKLYEKGSDVACFQLEKDVLPAEITPLWTDHLLLIAVGDTGTGNEEQFEVANGMAKVCQESGCDLVLLLGDDFYQDGFNSTEDPQVKAKI